VTEEVTGMAGATEEAEEAIGRDGSDTIYERLDR
jgi:hypothetical protein